jgi:hypothetical protein
MSEQIIASIYESKILNVQEKDKLYSKFHPNVSFQFSKTTPVYILNSIIRTIQSKLYSLSFDFDPNASTTDVEIDYNNTSPTIDKIEQLVRVISMLQVHLSEDDLENMIKVAKSEKKMDKKELSESESKSDTYEFLIDVDNKDIRYLLSTNDIRVYKNNVYVPDLTKRYFPQEYILKHLGKNQKIVVNMYPSLGTGNIHSRWIIGDGYYDAITKEMIVIPKSSYSAEYMLYKSIKILIEELDVLESLGEYGKTLEETLKLTTNTGKSFRFYHTTEKNEIISEMFSKFCYEFGTKKRQYGFNSCVNLKPHVGESCIQFQIGFSRNVSASFVRKFIVDAKNELQKILNSILTVLISLNDSYKRLSNY